MPLAVSAALVCRRFLTLPPLQFSSHLFSPSVSKSPLHFSVGSISPLVLVPVRSASYSKSDFKTRPDRYTKLKNDVQKFKGSTSESTQPLYKRRVKPEEALANYVKVPERPFELLDMRDMAEFFRLQGFTSAESVRYAQVLHRYLILRGKVYLIDSFFPSPDKGDQLTRKFSFAKQTIEGISTAALAVLDKALACGDVKFITTQVVLKQTTANGATTKLLLRLPSGHQVETVVIRHFPRRAETNNPGWVTVCVSSQVGCAMACSFCATGTLGLEKNLTMSEIVQQVVHANRVLHEDLVECADLPDEEFATRVVAARVRNVVFMGMGEPLRNYTAVVDAVKLLTDQKSFAMGLGKVTVSTVGIPSRIMNLAKDANGCSLAISLHAPTQELRETIIPSAKAYPLTQIIKALDFYVATTGRRIMVQYTLLAGVNDSIEHAHQLGRLIGNRGWAVNLIPYNPTNVKQKFSSPGSAAIEAFWKVLVDQYKLVALIRREFGGEVQGACGQLARNQAATEFKSTTAADASHATTASTSASASQHATA